MARKKTGKSKPPKARKRSGGRSPSGKSKASKVKKLKLLARRR